MRWVKALVLMGIGGLVYTCVEFIWRLFSGHLPVHWTMALLGGLLFVLSGAINEYIPWCIPLWRQGVIGALIVTWAELVAGLVLNVWLRLGIWDYSNFPGNFMGQICPQFTAAWALLSIVAVVLDDWLRYWLFGEERPYYKIWRCT